MGTINVSLPDDMIEKIDGMVNAKNYASRSEFIRDSLRGFFSEAKLMAGLTGVVSAVVTVTFNVDRRGVSDEINQIQHKYDDVILTNVHIHQEKICLEVILAKGEISRIREVIDRLKIIRGVETVRVTVA